jgi:hypothetical protein
VNTPVIPTPPPCFELVQCCEAWKHATSYWETAWPLAGVPVFSPLPAYTPPAMPPFSLNADPLAFAALPGSFGAVALRHDCDGWPVLPPVWGSVANAEPASVRASVRNADPVAMSLFTSPPLHSMPAPTT